MTDIQENKLTMYQAVIVFLWANITLWENLPAFSDLANKVKSIITAIQNLAQIQAADKKGLTVNKLQIQADLIRAAIKLVKAMKAYARISKNDVLFNEVSFTKSAMELSRDNQIHQDSLFILSKAQALETELLDYMIKTDDLTKVSDLALQYEEAMPQKRDADVIKKNATAQMDAEYDEADKALADLDILVPIFEDDHPEFVSGYFDARIIIDRGHRFSDDTRIRGKVTDAQNQLPIVRAEILIRETGQNQYTLDDGTFSMKIPEAGNYTVEVHHQGYQTYTHDTVHLNTGSRVALDIQLQP
ncbi:MAG: carboxypeptidase-like regulatory domain-containing protein, partial [Bacteroidales bacterium]|nr:carboxypeptidase-like regulatory domain-containing protein [Bacteroidales bacterium]